MNEERLSLEERLKLLSALFRVQIALFLLSLLEALVIFQFWKSAFLARMQRSYAAKREGLSVSGLVVKGSPAGSYRFPRGEKSLQEILLARRNSLETSTNSTNTTDTDASQHQAH